jgi:hypothetical protein
MKVIGAGLNKTGTKTLRYYLMRLGFRHRSYELPAFRQYRAGRIAELLDSMESFDSFEDWPWPLMYREIDERYPDAQFVLTMRRSPEVWYRSLCQMAVRMGPLRDYEKHIYGYAMPQGRKQQHMDFYNRHNQQVIDYFADRPGKLLQLCWDDGGDARQLASFLGLTDVDVAPRHVNPGLPVYGGDRLWLAQANRIVFQTKWKAIDLGRKVARKLRRG